MEKFPVEQMDMIEKFDYGIIKKLIRKITRYDTCCIIEFKSGNTVKVPR